MGDFMQRVRRGLCSRTEGVPSVKKLHIERGYYPTQAKRRLEWEPPSAFPCLLIDRACANSRTSAAKAARRDSLYGTAEAVPFRP
jgi:hypothetical protein